MKIVFVEPDVLLADTYRRGLEAAGHVVTVAHIAQDAIHAVDDTQPDLVILELQLAGHNGLEFVHEFRSYPEWQHIPILVLTMVPPHALRITKEIQKEMGIANCLYKPATTLKQLIQSIEGFA